MKMYLGDKLTVAEVTEELLVLGLRDMPSVPGTDEFLILEAGEDPAQCIQTRLIAPEKFEVECLDPSVPVAHRISGIGRNIVTAIFLAYFRGNSIDLRRFSWIDITAEIYIDIQQGLATRHRTGPLAPNSGPGVVHLARAGPFYTLICSIVGEDIIRHFTERFGPNLELIGSRHTENPRSYQAEWHKRFEERELNGWYMLNEEEVNSFLG